MFDARPEGWDMISGAVILKAKPAQATNLLDALQIMN